MTDMPVRKLPLDELTARELTAQRLPVKRAWRPYIFLRVAMSLPVLLGCIGTAIWSERSLAEDATQLHLSCVDFPPYKIAPTHDAQQEPDAQPGIDVEIIKAAFAGTAYNPEFDFMPFKRAIELAARGDYAGICGCSYSAARAETFIFSDPVDIVSIGLFSDDEAALADIKTMSDLKGRSVIAVNGYVLEKDLQAVGADISLVPTDKQAAIMLSHRRGSLLASYRLPVEYWRGHEGLTDPIFYRELSSGPNHLCLSRASPLANDAMAVFNASLKRLSESGEIEQIRKRYNVVAALPVN